MTISINEVFHINDSLKKLFESETKFPLNIGFEIFNMIKQLTEIEEYVFQRMEKVLSSDKLSEGNLTDEEMSIYNAIVNSKIELEPFSFDKNDMMKNNSVELPLKDIANICRLFDENKE